MQRIRLARDVWLAPTGENKKGTPIQLNMKTIPLRIRRGFIFSFFAYEIRRNTSSRLRFLSVTYVCVRSRQEIRALLVLLVFPNGRAAQYFVALTFSKAQNHIKKNIFYQFPPPVYELK